MVEPGVDHLVERVTGRWIRRHVGAFLEWTKLRSRRNAICEPTLYTVMAELDALGLSGQAEIDVPLRLHRQTRRSGAAGQESTSADSAVCSHPTISIVCG